jgi:hypothetical protein
MTQQEIQERNKQIALMLGLKLLGKPYLGAYSVDTITHNTSFYHERMEGESWYVYPEYHSDWNWLMEAVDFIEKKGYSIDIHQNRAAIKDNFACNDKFEEIIKVSLSSKKEAVFIAVSDFAKFYNEGKL